MESNKIIEGDCIEELKKLPENSVDAIVTDPPYGLGFMNKEWDSPAKHRELVERELKRSAERKKQGKSPTDAPFSQSVQPGLAIKGAKEGRWYQEWCEQWSKELFRVLKPGGYFLSFCATRMYHRMTCGIEDAGFEIRDTIMWLYGSGFPKSLNIGKQIDKIEGNEREVVGENKNARINPPQKDVYEAGIRGKECDLTKGNSEWEGWGTALKPACEPIVVARKPLSEKNVALNVLKWGTGGINIDGCRVGDGSDKIKGGCKKSNEGWNKLVNKHKEQATKDIYSKGRFPANIILDEEAGKMLDKQSGILGSNSLAIRKTFNTGGSGNVYTTTHDNIGNVVSIKGKGGASRFFYCAKASKSERNYGCDDLESKRGGSMEANTTDTMQLGGASLKGEPKEIQQTKNNHPTVKPIALMEYLIRLVTPKGGIVLDPFLGSGTTAIACIKEGANYIGIEKEPEYIKIAKSRLKPYLEQKKLINYDTSAQPLKGKG